MSVSFAVAREPKRRLGGSVFPGRGYFVGDASFLQRTRFLLCVPTHTNRLRGPGLEPGSLPNWCSLRVLPPRSSGPLGAGILLWNKTIAAKFLHSEQTCPAMGLDQRASSIDCRGL